MDINQQDIEEFANNGEPADLRKFVTVIAGIVSKQQLRALQPYFLRKVTFMATPAKVAPQAKETAQERKPTETGEVDEDEDEDNEEDDAIARMLKEEAAKKQAPIQPAPYRRAEDFGFGDMDVPERRPVGRPRISREESEKEFEATIQKHRVAL